MADQILSSYKCEDDGNPCHWEFSYSVESAGKTNNFCVLVEAEEMTDPASATEAKTKANVKAAAIKSAWVAALAADTETITPDITVPENVTL